MLPLLALALEGGGAELLEGGLAFLSFLGAKSFYDKVKNDGVFVNSSSNIFPSDLDYSNDTATTKPSNSDISVFDVNEKEFQVPEISLGEFKELDYSEIDDNVDLTSLKEVVDKMNVLDKVTVDDVSSKENLLDVLKIGNENLIKSIAGFGLVLQNLSQILGVSLPVIAKGISDLVKVQKENSIRVNEYYDYLRNPVDIKTLDGEVVARVSPRDISVLSEGVKYLLNSQEASITAEDLGLDDYDESFDINDVLLKLFNFEGISKDIEKFKG